MDFKEYQTQAKRTLGEGRNSLDVAVMALGLAGEAGEVVDLLKKHIGHGHALDVGLLSKELGDVLWYVAALATQHNIDLGDVAEWNIAKLRRRYPEGFSEAASQARIDEVKP
jgi:NTP pyrophosphatase (non-canonical NTP hydrolase)